MRIAVVPGSFDPMTIGHINIIERASELFDKVFVAVMINDTKTYMFTREQRTQIAKLSLAHLENVEVIFDDGMLWELALRLDACAIVKGIRDYKDYQYEFEMAQYNFKKNPHAQTVFLPCDEGAREISSTAVREKLSLGKDISDIISKNAIEYIYSLD
jgi:pantetheine-phosphate adenylyltransferase